MELKINKKLEEIIPKLSLDTFKALKENIREKGLIKPIDVMTDGTIVDGHHRYKACKELEMEPEASIIKIKSLEEAIDYSFSVNFHRRQLNAFQKVEWLNEWENARRDVGGRHFSDEKSTLEDKGNRVGLAGSIVSKGLKILDVASEEVKDKLRNEEWTINYAYQGYQTLEKVTDKSMKEKLKENFEEERVTPSQLIKIVGLTNIAEEEIGNTTETIAEKVREKFGSQFWTEGLDIKELEHSIRELEGAPQELKTVEIETARFGSKDEAEKFFKKCGGHLSGLKSYYIGKVDPLKYKPMETKEEE
jgi:ParB-like chromosome segregation protein Spo0J